MNRLTANIHGEIVIPKENVVNGNLSPFFEKLGRYEDIDDYLGISIAVIIKAIRYGIYYYYEGKIEHSASNSNYFICLNLDSMSLDLMYASPYENCCYVEAHYSLDDYKNTWALHKEDLK